MHKLMERKEKHRGRKGRKGHGRKGRRKHHR